MDELIFLIPIDISHIFDDDFIKIDDEDPEGYLLGLKYEDLSRENILNLINWFRIYNLDASDLIENKMVQIYINIGLDNMHIEYINENGEGQGVDLHLDNQTLISFLQLLKSQNIRIYDIMGDIIKYKIPLRGI